MKTTPINLDLANAIVEVARLLKRDFGCDYHIHIMAYGQTIARGPFNHPAGVQIADDVKIPDYSK